MDTLKYPVFNLKLMNNNTYVIYTCRWAIETHKRVTSEKKYSPPWKLKRARQGVFHNMLTVRQTSHVGRFRWVENQGEGGGNQGSEIKGCMREEGGINGYGRVRPALALTHCPVTLCCDRVSASARDRAENDSVVKIIRAEWRTFYNGFRGRQSPLTYWL